MVIFGCFWKPRPKARDRPAFIVVRNPASKYTAQLVFRQGYVEVPALSAQDAKSAFTEIEMGA